MTPKANEARRDALTNDEVTAVGRSGTERFCHASFQDPRPFAQTVRDKAGVPGLLSFTSWAATPAAQDLRGGSTQRADRSVHRYVR